MRKYKNPVEELVKLLETGANYLFAVFMVLVIIALAILFIKKRYFD